MSKWIVLISVIFLSISQGSADVLLDQRRIEENKRLKLRASEAQDIEPVEQAKLQKSTNLVYFESLLNIKRATWGDLTKTITVMIGRFDEYPDFASQRALFLKEKWTPKYLADGFTAESFIQKGQAAFVFCRVLQIKGGLVLRLFGLSERYALKELVYRGIAVGGSQHEIMTGKELVYMFIKSVEYLAGHTGPN